MKEEHFTALSIILYRGNVAQEGVSQASSLRGALDQTSNVRDRQHGGHLV